MKLWQCTPQQIWLARSSLSTTRRKKMIMMMGLRKNQTADSLGCQSRRGIPWEGNYRRSPRWNRHGSRWNDVIDSSEPSPALLKKMWSVYVTIQILTLGNLAQEEGAEGAPSRYTKAAPYDNRLGNANKDTWSLSSGHQLWYTPTVVSTPPLFNSGPRFATKSQKNILCWNAILLMLPPVQYLYLVLQHSIILWKTTLRSLGRGPE